MTKTRAFYDSWSEILTDDEAFYTALGPSSRSANISLLSWSLLVSPQQSSIAIQIN